ncbi:MAG: response regulator [Dehalococcoidia bacterium]|nr:response regulator [Dehalococcoidia bacterium]
MNRVNNHKKQVRILAVDDEEHIRKFYKDVLGMAGYSVDTAADGNSALTLLEERPPDIVILDIVMPGLDGYQVLSLLRQRSDVPVIMVTGNPGKIFISQSFGLVADDYITKPFNPQVLLACIQTKLERSNDTGIA